MVYAGALSTGLKSAASWVKK